MIKDQYGVPWEKEVVVPEDTGSMIGRDVTRWRVKFKPSWHRQEIRGKDGNDYLRIFEIPKGETPVMGRNYEKLVYLGPLTGEFICGYHKVKDDLKNFLQSRIFRH